MSDSLTKTSSTFFVPTLDDIEAFIYVATQKREGINF